VFVWPEGDFCREPELYGSHMEEVRSGHAEEPERPPVPGPGGPIAWDGRLRELGGRYKSAVVSVMAPDGFPMSARVGIETDEPAGRIRLKEDPMGVPLAAGRACLTAHDHHPEFKWQ